MMRPYPILILILMAMIAINACTDASSPTPVVGSFKGTPTSTDPPIAASPDSTSEATLPAATSTLLDETERSTPTPKVVAEGPCTPTSAGDLGPEYVWNAPMRSSVGQGHVLTGVVKSSVDCSPIPQAKLEFWLAGPNGQYDDDHRATTLANEMGVYRFESNFPGKYPERPVPHIHMYVSAQDYRGVITEYHPPQGQTEGALDIVLAPADPTVTIVTNDNQIPLVSTTGRLAFHTLRDENMEIYVMDIAEALKGADGAEPINLTNNPAEDYFPVWSPDGQQIAFTSDRDGNPEIYVLQMECIDLAEGCASEPINLTNNPDEDIDHTWSPDGSQIAFASNRDGNWEIYLMNTECVSHPEECGSGVTRLTDNPADDWSPAWSPDGSRIAFSSGGDIWLINPECVSLPEGCGSEPINLTNHPAEEDQPAWSPDSARLAFTSLRDDNPEIYIMPVPGSAKPNSSELIRMTNSPAEDSFPAWSPDGTRLAFKSTRDGNYEIYLVNADCVSLSERCGSGLTRLTDNPAGDGFPAWRPDPSSATGAIDGETNGTANKAECVLTPGSWFNDPPTDNLSLPSKLKLASADEPGERLIISGTVYAEDCILLAGAIIEVWHANTAGEYTDLEGQLRTDSQGRYEFETIKPGFYGAPAHIHFRVSHPQAEPLESEFFFAGDPHLDSSAPTALITTLTTEEDAEESLLRGVFDIVLQNR